MQYFAILTTPEIVKIEKNFKVSLQAMRVLKITSTEFHYIDEWDIDEYIHHADARNLALRVEARAEKVLYVYRDNLYQVMTAEEMGLVRSLQDAVGNIEQAISDAHTEVQAAVRETKQTMREFAYFIRKLIR